jgi:hypothetical protein
MAGDLSPRRQRSQLVERQTQRLLDESGYLQPIFTEVTKCNVAVFVSCDAGIAIGAEVRGNIRLAVFSGEGLISQHKTLRGFCEPVDLPE